MSAPFAYEDLQEGHIKSLEALNNRHDPTGKLNELRLPPLRRRQQASRPKFYEPTQHSSTPRLSVTINAPPTMSLSAPYPVSITLRHHLNPTGNPLNQPVTLAWKDTALNEICDTELSPWLFLHHADGKLKELDDGNNGPGFAEMNSELEEKSAISAQNGFISLAVEESRVVEVDFRYSGDGLQLASGETYSIGFRGSRIHWWKWGDDFKGQHKETLEISAAMRAMFEKGVLCDDFKGNCLNYVCFEPRKGLDQYLAIQSLESEQVTVRDLFELRLLPGTHMDVIGCQSGRADLGINDDQLGISTALFYAGAASVITALWSTNIADGTAKSKYFLMAF
ncbi:hypothetical protein G7Y79_00021g049600 [Physcia stellaris]|nr:hypothetical protein G7Y79_00021g049600 [Physcia stellaris]